MNEPQPKPEAVPDMPPDGEIPADLKAHYLKSVSSSGASVDIQSNVVSVARLSMVRSLAALVQSDDPTLNGIDDGLVSAIIWLMTVIIVLVSSGALLAFLLSGSFLAFMALALILPLIGHCQITVGQDEQTAAVFFQAQLGSFVFYQSVTYFDDPIVYETDPMNGLSFTYPPSAASFIEAPNFGLPTAARSLSHIPTTMDDHSAAVAILRGTLIGLWATGYLAFVHYVTESRYFVESFQTSAKLNVRSVPDVDASALGYLEYEIVEMIRKCEKSLYFETAVLQWLAAPSLDALFKRVGQGTPASLTQFVMRNSRHTLLSHGIAQAVKGTSQWLSIMPDARESLLRDAAVLQTVAHDAATIYRPVAAEIDRALNYLYRAYWWTQ